MPKTTETKTTRNRPQTVPAPRLAPTPNSPSGPPPNITHRQLAMFRAIMLHSHLGRAAETMNSSQPTLSRDLARLEQLLGFALFDRVSGRLRPTQRALALMEEVERSFVGLEHIARRAVELRTRTTGRLRIACLPALAHALLPQALVHFYRTHPHTRVSIVPLESPWLEQALSEQRFDLGVGETTEPPTGVVLTPLMQMNEVAVLPANHPLCRKRLLRATDFSGQIFVSLAEGDPYRQAIDAMFAQANVQRAMVLETASAVAVCAMVQQGLGVAIVNPLTAAAMAGPALVVRALQADISFRVSLLLPQLAAPHPLRDSLVTALHQTCDAMVQKR